MLSKTILLGLLIAAAAVLPAQTIRVVATQPDLADLARAIGGSRVEVYCLTRGTEDLHRVKLRPSHLVRTSKAQVFIQLGLDAEHAWVPALLRSSRNRSIQPGQPGFVDCSKSIEPLGVSNQRSREHAVDLHPHGNPHYNSDPERMRKVARTICQGLSRIDQAGSAEFEKRRAAWEKKLDQRLAQWRKKLAPHRGATFIDHHNSWIYFAKRFDLKLVDHLEPSPGVPPTAEHLKRIVKLVKEQDVGLIVARPAILDLARKVASESGIKAVGLPRSSTSTGHTSGWFQWMDHVVDTFETHLKPR